MAYLLEDLALGCCDLEPKSKSHEIVFLNIVIGNSLTFGADKLKEVMEFLNSLSVNKVEKLTWRELNESTISHYIGT